MAPHISVQIASGTVPATVCRAWPFTLRTRTRFSNLEYRYIFSEIRSRNTTGMVSSPPVSSRVCPLQLLSLSKNSFTSGWATISRRCSSGKASKALRPTGRERIPLFNSIFLSFLSFFFSFCGVGGTSLSSFSKSASNPWISADRVVFASSCAFFSAS